jgi:hypothetical protein
MALRSTISSLPILSAGSRGLAASSVRSISSTSRLRSDPSKHLDGPGRENSNDRPSSDGLDVQSDASKSGKADRVTGGSKSSSATSEKDHGNTEKTKKEFPEAPDAHMGMQDERGSVSHSFLASYTLVVLANTSGI